MLRRNIILRREYLYMKSLKGKERLLYEKKRKIKEALEEGKPIPTELRNEESALRQEIDLEDKQTADVVLVHEHRGPVLLHLASSTFFSEQSPTLPTLSTQHFRLSTITISTWTTHLLSDAYSLILHHCSSTQSLKQTKQAHALALLHGLLHSTPSICASLMLSYASFASSSTSRLLFDQSSLKLHDAFLWNTLIRAYSIDGAHYNALETYNRMVRNGVRLDDYTFPFVLKVCADFSDFKKGKEIHGLVLKLGFYSDVFVGNTLVGMYAVMNLWDAQKVFDEMSEQDIVSWNSIIAAFSVNGLFLNALDLFLKLKSTDGLMPNSVTVVSVLPVCAELEYVETATEIHGYVVKAGLDSQMTVCNALVDLYGKCGNLKASKVVFDGMTERNVVSWNAVIAGFARKGLVRGALDMFRLMVAVKEKPDSITLSTLLPVSIELGLFNMGKEIHGYSIRRAIESDVFVANSLIDMYAKLGHSKEASNVFYKMDTRSVVTWNAMVANFAQNGLEFEAIRLITRMQLHGDCPNSVTFTNILPACARIGFLRQGKEIHSVSIRKGFSLDLFVSNALTDMYAKCGFLTLARSVFDISLRDEVSYNILIVGYSQSDHCSESLHLFSEMMFTGLKLDTVSFVGVLSACAYLNAVKHGKEIHGLLIRKLFHSHLFVSNSLLDLYTKCGQLDYARKVFDQIPNKDVASWNTMILGYGMQGELEVAIDLFDSMRNGDVEYDSVSYIAVLSACSHGGLVERGIKYFHEMLSQEIKPTHMHYACIVDLLGRAGQVDEAVKLIKSLPMEPDANIWGALLGACRVHGNIELGRWAAEHLFELKPYHCGYYILLSNMYAEVGNWDEANRIRELMKSRGVKKNPGCSWVQVQHQMHAFFVGERLET